eukprot:1158301-Pelagomonas_calceolata.AAC.8
MGIWLKLPHNTNHWESQITQSTQFGAVGGQIWSFGVLQTGLYKEPKLENCQLGDIYAKEHAENTWCTVTRYIFLMEGMKKKGHLLPHATVACITALHSVATCNTYEKAEHNSPNPQVLYLCHCAASGQKTFGKDFCRCCHQGSN